MDRFSRDFDRDFRGDSAELTSERAPKRSPEMIFQGAPQIGAKEIEISIDSLPILKRAIQSLVNVPDYPSFAKGVSALAEHIEAQQAGLKTSQEAKSANSVSVVLDNTSAVMLAVALQKLQGSGSDLETAAKLRKIIDPASIVTRDSKLGDYLRPENYPSFTRKERD